MRNVKRAGGEATAQGDRASLSEVPIFASMPPGPRDRLADVITRLEFEPGVTFMNEGEVTASLAVVVRGRVGLRMRVPERGGVTILTLEAGDIVGWSAIVAPHRATTSATTLEATELAIVDAKTLRSLLANDCELAAALLPQILDTVVKRLAATRVQLLDLFQGSEINAW
ncbi:MAG: cyclic nucleotide-binding domain-containing protein [Chloroflexota bacterium]